jgi:carboxyl-terminal processing protease
MRRYLLAAAAVLAIAGVVAFRPPRSAVVATPAPAASCSAPPAMADDARGDAGKGADRLSGRTLQLPTGLPAGLSCQDARRVVAQSRLHLAAEPEPVDARALVEASIDWLDPHGLWSASPDAPLADYLRKHDRELVRELEAPGFAGPCRVAEQAGRIMSNWMATLTEIFDDAARRAEPVNRAEAWGLATRPVFEDRGVARPARELAQDLGHTIGTVEQTFGALTPFGRAAKERFVPALSPAAWSRAVLAAVLRAYVPQIDPHGGWAPLDEETSLYEVDLEAAPPPRLWDHMVRTPLGIVVAAGTAAPVAANDLILEVASVPTAGLSVEQVEQLSIFDDSEASSVRPVIVLRSGQDTPLVLRVSVPSASDKIDDDGALPTTWIPYGDGFALVVEISDVPDDLGDLLAATIGRSKTEHMPTGIVLDLRGNGGGSTDGANAALGLFLPGVRLFPMRRRDGVIETERAPEPPETDRWHGPVATLVDGDTASAAEMIAGALTSYHRGVVAGYRTYGKGCAQEYIDDEAHSGVLRLTTLVYALPDGSPVQRVGLLPGLYLGPRATGEREATLAHALATWRGPDVRDRDRIGEVTWTPHHGHVGPCADDVLCRTLRVLGAPRPPVARGRRESLSFAPSR